MELPRYLARLDITAMYFVEGIVNSALLGTSALKDWKIGHSFVERATTAQGVLELRCIRAQQGLTEVTK